MSGVRLVMQVPLSTTARVLIDHKVQEWRAQVGKWDIALTREGELIVRDFAGGYDIAPVLKVPAE